MTSYNYGPIKVLPERRNEVCFDEISFGVSMVSIIDSKWSGKPRENKFMNIVQTREGVDLREYYKFNGIIQDRLMIRLRVLQLSNEGETHEREAMNIVT